jgi:hypothetical protein
VARITKANPPPEETIQEEAMLAQRVVEEALGCHQLLFGIHDGTGTLVDDDTGVCGLQWLSCVSDVGEWWD